MTKNKHTQKAGNLMNLNIANTGFSLANDVEIPEVYNRRFKTGIAQLDELFQEGLLPGSTFTLTGTPGAGKTTLLLQMLDSIALTHGKKVGYVTGEESQVQLAFSSKRIGIKHVLIAHKTDIDEIANEVRKHKFDVLILDSFPTMKTSHLKTPKATEEYVVREIIDIAQSNECVVGVIQHITKKGDAKGSTLIPHSVDMNMSLDKGDEEMFGTDQARVLDVKKNRFGATGTATFFMTPKGMDLETDMNVIKRAVADRNNIQTPPKSAKRAADKNNMINSIIEKAKASTFGINLKQAVEITGNFYRGRNLLKEMEFMGQLTKSGRGDDASWYAKI